MKKQLLTIAIILLFASTQLSGCTETKKSSEPPTDNTIEPLTDADWNYFVWQHLSTDTITYYLTIIMNLTNNITKYTQKIAYLDLESTHQNFTQLNTTAHKWNQIIQQNSYDNSNFNLSSRMNQNRNIYALWLNDNHNISQISLQICNQFFSKDMNLRSTVTDSVKQMKTQKTSAQTHFNTLMNWVNNSISDQEYNTWTANRDWSFLERTPSG